MTAQFQYDTHLSDTPNPVSTKIALRQDLPHYDSGAKEKQKAKDIKKASRILRELTHDALKLFPLLPAPSAWLIRCLLSTHYCSPLQANWREAIMLTLLHIKQTSNPTLPNNACFFELDNKTPLFPNSEHFSLANTHLYASTMLRYLKAKALLDEQAAR